MHLLRNGVQSYAWGSHDAIPAFFGEQAADDPVAEVWIGTHPIKPSVAIDAEGRIAAATDLVQQMLIDEQRLLMQEG